MNNGAHEGDDMLHDMFMLQTSFMRRLQKVSGFPEFPLDMNEKESFAFLRDVGTRAVEEIFEALQHLKAGKPWRSDQDSWDRAAFVEEFVDAQRFLLEVLILLEVTPDEFMAAFKEKVDVTHVRLDEELPAQEPPTEQALELPTPTSAIEWHDCSYTMCGSFSCTHCYPGGWPGKK